MKLKSTILCLIILLTVSLSLGMVCAGDNTTHPLDLSVEESPIDVSENVEIDNDVSTLSSGKEEILSDGGGSFSELQELINSKGSGAVIDLNKNYSYKEGDKQSGIVIDKDLTINGNNNFLDGKNIARILNISNCNLVLNNINFVNGNATQKIYYTYGYYFTGDGGAIFSLDGNLTINACNFENNTGIYGGAIFDASNSYISILALDPKVKQHTLDINNSKFINNGYDYDNAYGGAIYCDFINVNNSLFLNNHITTETPNNIYGSRNAAGAIYVRFNATVLNSKFINNSARIGGAIYSELTSHFVNNEWVYYDNLIKVSNSTFEDNYASESGGAIFTFSNFFDENSKYINNSAYMQGGAIYSRINPIDLKNDEFINNNATYGGAISTIYIGNLDNLKFDSNNAFIGNNIAFNSSNIEMNVDGDDIYQFIYHNLYVLESGIHEVYYTSQVSDNYTLFFSYLIEEWGLNFNSMYPQIQTNGFYYADYWTMFSPKAVYAIADRTKLNDYLKLLNEFYADELDNEWVQSIIEGLTFTTEKWEELKLYKVNDVLSQFNITVSDPIPDNNYVTQINDTTYALFNFEILLSELGTTQYIKGPGYFRYWVPGYQVLYKTLDELANISVEKISLNNQVLLGETSSFDIIVKNTGLINLTDVFVIEAIPEGLTYVSHSNSDVWIKNGNKFTYLNTLGVNESVKFTIDFITSKIGNLTNVVTAGSNQTGNKTAENKTEVLFANLTVEKIALNKTLTIGEISSFNITVKNTGLVNLTGVFVIESIPDGLEYLSHSNSDVWRKDGNKFTYLNTLGVNETIVFTVNFNTTQIGNFTNVVTVGANKTENKTSNDTTEVLNKTTPPENETNTVENDENTDFDDYAMGTSSIYESASEDKDDKSNQTNSVDKNATGNPLFILLLALLILPLRRKRL